MNPGKYSFNPELETRVWKVFRGMLRTEDRDCIVNNTNCRIKYLQEIKANLNPNFKWEVELVYLEAPLWKLKIRNIFRYIKERKWIPVKVLETMYRNYKNINREEYERVFYK